MHVTGHRHPVGGVRTELRVPGRAVRTSCTGALVPVTIRYASASEGLLHSTSTNVWMVHSLPLSPAAGLPHGRSPVPPASGKPKIHLGCGSVTGARPESGRAPSAASAAMASCVQEFSVRVARRRRGVARSARGWRNETSNRPCCGAAGSVSACWAAFGERAGCATRDAGEADRRAEVHGRLCRAGQNEPGPVEDPAHVRIDGKHRAIKGEPCDGVGGVAARRPGRSVRSSGQPLEAIRRAARCRLRARRL